MTMMISPNSQQQPQSALSALALMLLLALVSLSSVLVPVQARAQQAGAGGLFQALYIYNFTKYVTYPSARNSGDYVIAVVGKSDVQTQLEKTASVKRASLTNQTIRVANYDDVAPAECHIIYVPEKSAKRLRSIVESVRNKPVLVVGEGSGLYNQGVPVSFVFASEKKFEISRGLLESVGMKVSSELLKVANVFP
jgi:hypothetical protein